MANNWISKRHSETGTSLNRTGNNGSQKGPLREVEYVVYSTGNGMFDHDKVHLVCGHEVFGTIGAARVRCYKCKEK